MFRGEVSEIGWLPVRSSDPELVPEGPWFQWHFDSFTVPPGATVIAETDVGPQAFVAGRSLGLQFHPEVTTQIMDDWVRAYRHELDADGVDPDALLEETKRLADESRARALQLFERYLHDVAQLDVSRRPTTPTSRWAERVTPTGIASNDTHVFPRFLDLEYPSVERGDGVWLTTTDGRRILDACSGGAMVACLGHGVPEIVDAAAEQAERISYFYNHHFTSEPQERLADRVLEVVAPGMARVRLVSGRLRGERDGAPARPAVPRRARRHRALARDLAGAGVPRVHDGDARADRQARAQGAVRARTWRRTSTSRPRRGASTRRGEAALEELDRRLEEAGPETVSAFFCEPVSAAALPAASPPDRFWKGLAERRDEHGFLICFDEVVSGIGRVGTWLAADQLPIEPDIVAIGKGLGAGYAPLGAVLCRAARVRGDRPRVARVRPRTHVGRRAAVLGRRAGRARPPGRARPGRAGPRPRPRLRDELEAALDGIRDRARGAGQRLPPRRGARGPTGRGVLPARSTSTWRRSSTTRPSRTDSS